MGRVKVRCQESRKEFKGRVKELRRVRIWVMWIGNYNVDKKKRNRSIMQFKRSRERKRIKRDEF